LYAIGSSCFARFKVADDPAYFLVTCFSYRRRGGLIQKISNGVLDSFREIKAYQGWSVHVNRGSLANMFNLNASPPGLHLD
jgi:hypothetical protein